jgi:hypothetical protein
VEPKRCDGCRWFCQIQPAVGECARNLHPVTNMFTGRVLRGLCVRTSDHCPHHEEREETPIWITQGIQDVLDEQEREDA